MADDTRPGPDPQQGHTPAEPYTIHDDTERSEAGTGGATGIATDAGGGDLRATGRAGPDPIGLVAGLLALLVAALALTDTLDTIDPRWVLAGGAIALGTLVLLATARRR